MTDDERPRWSVTWLFRVQRVGRHRADPGTPAPRAQWFPWAVLLVLLVEVALGVWLGLLPR